MVHGAAVALNSERLLHHLQMYVYTTILTHGKLLASDNGISTSYFQLYDAADGQLAVTLNNFCKLQDMGTDDEDDILSCVHFLLVDVMTARRVLKGLAA